jgi:uncharacterized protein YfiM (DUF2279 family)
VTPAVLAGALVALVALAPPTAAQTAAPSNALAYRLPGRALDLPPPARPDSARSPEPWLARDKAIHAGGSFLFVLAAQYVLTDKAGVSDGAALPVAAGVALGIGLAREVHDGRRAVASHFSVRDLVADAFGVALGALVTQL